MSGVLPSDHPTPRLEGWRRSEPAPGLLEYAAPSGDFRLHCEAAGDAVRLTLRGGDGTALLEERLENPHAAAALADHLAANAHRYATDWG